MPRNSPLRQTRWVPIVDMLFYQALCKIGTNRAYWRAGVPRARGPGRHRSPQRPSPLPHLWTGLGPVRGANYMGLVLMRLISGGTTMSAELGAAMRDGSTPSLAYTPATSCRRCWGFNGGHRGRPDNAALFSPNPSCVCARYAMVAPYPAYSQVPRRRPCESAR